MQTNLKIRFFNDVEDFNQTYIGSCIYCGNFVSFNPQTHTVTSQGLKSQQFDFKPEVNYFSILSSLKQVKQDSIKSIQYNTNTSYYQLRKKKIKFLIQCSDRFEFGQETKHYAISLLDTLLF